MSYLIKDGKLIAETSIELKSGLVVRVAYKACINAMDASRERDLVNAFDVKVSNAKKWNDKEALSAIPINDSNDEFLIL